MCKYYDFVSSLGGNCAAAHNLLYRNMRMFALPFDWTYFIDETAVYNLADGFKNRFSNYLLKENLEELPSNPNHLEYVQYKDMLSGIIWANHFRGSVSNNAEYVAVKSKLNRRFQRLLSCVEKSTNVLFLFCVSFDIDIKPFEYLLKELKQIYSNKNIDIKVICFGCKDNGVYSEHHIEIFKYTRSMNDYDFTKTNYEWAFLDSIKLTKLFKKKDTIKLFSFSILKKQIKCELSWKHKD